VPPFPKTAAGIGLEKEEATFLSLQGLLVRKLIATAVPSLLHRVTGMFVGSLASCTLSSWWLTSVILATWEAEIWRITWAGCLGDPNFSAIG
jgi:hypothetical protein